jgi:hypothetical protein
MTNEHHQPSPEPWTVLYSPYTLADGSELPAYEVIADEKVCDLNENMPPAIQEANAHLIAASPALRAAVELAVQALNTAPRFQVPHLDMDSYAIASMCDRAIAEAKGGAA